IPRAKSNQAGRCIVNSARISKWLEVRVRVLSNTSELIVVKPLRDNTSGRVDDESNASEMIGHQPIRNAALDHIVRHILARAIHESRHDLIASIQLRDRRE